MIGGSNVILGWDGERLGSNVPMKCRDTRGSPQGPRIHSLYDWRIQCHIGVGGEAQEQEAGVHL